MKWNFNFKLLLPLFLIEIYLILTLGILKYGPIEWKLENEKEFWILILLYHVATILGYLLPLRFFKKDHSNIAPLRLNPFEFVLKRYWFFWIIALIGTIISYRNTICTPSFIPFNFFSDFIYGLRNPGIVRGEFITAYETVPRYKIVTMLYGGIAFVKCCIIPTLVIVWPRLSITKKLSGIFLALVPFVASVSIGTNKLVFDSLFLFAFSIFIVLLIQDKTSLLERLNARKFICVITLGLLIFAPMYFNKTMSSRNIGNFSYMEKVTKSGNIKVAAVEGGATLFMSRVSAHLVQGYYGMSLAIDEEFTSTFGIGSSNFLLDQFKYFFNINLATRTYQHKVHHLWDRFVQWHSFYSQVANDVSFYGVVAVLFVLSCFLSLVCRSAIIEGNLVAMLLLPLFAIMFIYMPANNQIFNMMETLFTFFTLVLIWCCQQFLYRKSSV